MTISNKTNRVISHTKNRTGFIQIPEFASQMKFWGIDASVVNKELLSKDIESIRLHYDKHRTWLTIKSAGFIGFFILLINTWWSNILSPLFIISFIFSMVGALAANRAYNITFNTLIKKMEQDK